MPPGSALAGLSSTYSGMWIVESQDAEARDAWQAFHYAANNLALVLAHPASASSNANQNEDPSTSLQKVPNSDAPPISNSFDSKPRHRCVGLVVIKPLAVLLIVIATFWQSMANLSNTSAVLLGVIARRGFGKVTVAKIS
jgi:hypothetical protein